MATGLFHGRYEELELAFFVWGDVPRDGSWPDLALAGLTLGTKGYAELAAKDAGLIVEMGRGLGVPTPAGAAVLQVLVGAIAGGLGDHDWGDLVAAAERQGDVELRWGQ